MNHHLRKHLSTFFRFALSAGLLAYLFRQIDFQKTLDIVQSADLSYVFYSFVIFVALNGLILLRWNIFVRGLELEVPFLTVVRYFMVGLFGNLFLPSSIGGDVIKILGLCRYTSQRPRVVASVLLDRLSGFAGMAAVAIPAFAVAHHRLQDPQIMILVLAIVTVSLAVGCILFNERVYHLFCRVMTFPHRFHKPGSKDDVEKGSRTFRQSAARLLARIPEGFVHVRKGMIQMHYDIALLKGRRQAIYQAVAMSAAGQLVFAFAYYLLARALHQDVSLTVFFVFVPLICVASSFPSIGGLGVREAGTVYLFSKVGIDPGVAVSISLMNFLFMVLVGLSGGLVSMVTQVPVRVEPEATGGESRMNAS